MRSQLFGPVAWSVASSWASFERPNGQFIGIQQINGDRFEHRAARALAVRLDAGLPAFRRAAIDTRDTTSTTCRSAHDEEPERKIWMGSVDSGLFFERESELFGGGIQTLEPRLFYLYQQYRNQNELPQFDVSDLSSRSTSCFATTASPASTASAMRIS